MIQTVVFVSNYINHHQMPLCEALVSHLGDGFTFIQTQPMDEERVRMGWSVADLPSYVRLYYEAEEECRALIRDADAVVFGGCDEETFIEERLKSGKMIFRYMERLYKEGQWKFISPRGLLKKYKDHGSHKKDPVYLLCAGGYVASDFHLIHAYPGKMYRWGYFPRIKEYEPGYLQALKAENEVPVLLWAGRMIDWKHPELAVETAAYLKEKNIPFRMRIIGGGDMEEEIRALSVARYVTDSVEFLGFLSPEEVRKEMEKADVYLFTSDRKEGWGAVLNEAMNSGCAVVADHMIGAAPYLIYHGRNGFLYRDGSPEELFRLTEKLLTDNILRDSLGQEAVREVQTHWNPEKAAEALLKLMHRLAENPEALPESGLLPCCEAPVLKERNAYEQLTKSEK